MPTTTKTITALFTLAGAPKTGLSATVDIWRVSDDVRVVTAGAMTELLNGVASGFYKFDFAAFDNAEEYVFKANAGVTAPVNVDAQFAYGSISGTREQIADAVWDEVEADHVAVGSMGLAMQLVRAALLNALVITEVDEKNFNYVIKDDGGGTLLSGTISAVGAVETRSKAS